MLLREVEYAKPASVAEALELLAANDGARALAGGQTLINVMKARAASPDALVDLNGLARAEGDRARRRRDADDRRDDDLHRDRGLGRGEGPADPRRGVREIADVQVRNRGTIGGNICSNDPTNHLPPLMAAIGARMTIAGAAGVGSTEPERAGAGSAGSGANIVEREVSAGRVLPRRLHDRGRTGRAADPDHHPGRQGRRLRGGHPRRRRDLHRERGRDDRRRRARRARLRRRRPGRRHRRRGPTRSPRPCARRESTRPPTSTPRASTGRTSPRCSPCGRPGRPRKGAEWQPSRPRSRSASPSTARPTSARSRPASS